MSTLPKTVDVPEIPFEDAITCDPKTTALLIVDMQHDFVDPQGSLHVPDAARTVPPIKDLLTRARKAGAPVFYTQDSHLQGDREFEIWPPHCIQGTEGWKLINELTPQAGEVVFEKPRYDGFYQSQLDHYLTRIARVESLIICGTVANICVGQTAASAGLRWLDVIVARDTISALTDFDELSALRQISMLYNGRLTPTAAQISFKPDRD